MYTDLQELIWNTSGGFIMKRKLALILTCTMAATALFACGKDKENEGLKTEPVVEEQPAAEEPAAETAESSAPTY